ncbi:MAG: aspartyl protease family protein [Rhodoferax sp.]|nr:aspartyl protease family protein [Rhodoferax sp.]
MPSITVSNGAAGPTLNVLIGPSEPLQKVLEEAGLPVPSPVSGVFLVDTGASHTVVDQRLIQPLGLSPTGTVLCHTPSTAGNAVPMYQYDLLIYIPSNSQTLGWYLDAVPVMAGSFEGQAIDGLIGRDILDRGLLVYNGQNGHFTLAY